jgi:hypothetical protein
MNANKLALEIASTGPVVVMSTATLSPGASASQQHRALAEVKRCRHQLVRRP